jgi:formylglycine-generating enzyme
LLVVYPTGSNTAPINTLPDPGNHANSYDVVGTGNHSYTIGSPYYRTNVGDFVNSASPYGTFDQGGNVSEWNETVLFGSSRGLRGGSFNDISIRNFLNASLRDFDNPVDELSNEGFRLAALIPEPCSITLFLGAVIMLTVWTGRMQIRKCH